MHRLTGALRRDRQHQAPLAGVGADHQALGVRARATGATDQILDVSCKHGFGLLPAGSAALHRIQNQAADGQVDALGQRAGADHQMNHVVPDQRFEDLTRLLRNIAVVKHGAVAHGLRADPSSPVLGFQISDARWQGPGLRIAQGRRQRQRLRQLVDEFSREALGSLVAPLVRSEDRGGPHWHDLSGSGDGLRLDGGEAVGVLAPRDRIGEGETVAIQEAIEGETSFGRFVRVHRQANRCGRAFAQRLKYGELGCRRAISAANDCLVGAAEPRIDLLDVGHDGGHEDKARCGPGTRLHARQQQLEPDTARLAVQQVALVADHQRNSLSECRLGAEDSRQRLGRRNHGPDLIQTVDFVARRHCAAVRAARGQAHRVQAGNEGPFQFRGKGTEGHEQHCDVVGMRTQVPVEQGLAERRLAGAGGHLQSVAVGAVQQAAMNGLDLRGEEFPA